jgi:hypothetical protein
MANEASTTNLSVAEVRALADRLQARAISAFSVDAPSQQGDGLLAAAALLHLVIELQTLRGEIDRIATLCTDEEAARALFDALTERGEHHSGLVAIRFDKP